MSGVCTLAVTGTGGPVKNKQSTTLLSIRPLTRVCRSFSQGLKEESYGIPTSPLMGASTSLPESMHNFIQYVAEPLFKVIYV
eukprot:4652471-Pyramimonas_sp.AAC.1